MQHNITFHNATQEIITLQSHGSAAAIGCMWLHFWLASPLWFCRDIKRRICALAGRYRSLQALWNVALREKNIRDVFWLACRWKIAFNLVALVGLSVVVLTSATTAAAAASFDLCSSCQFYLVRLRSHWHEYTVGWVTAMASSHCKVLLQQIQKYHLWVPHLTWSKAVFTLTRVRVRVSVYGC